MTLENQNTQASQPERFKKAASEVEADQSDDALDRIMGKLDLKKKLEATPQAKEPRSSDTRR